MRIYLSASNDLYASKVQCVIRRLLVSFHAGTRKTVFNGWINSGRPHDWCVDSGAHHYLNAWFKKRTLPPIAEVEKHIQDLVAFIRSAPVRPAFVVEEDLQDLYGRDVVEAWRRDIWKPLERETGTAVCYVWHVKDGEKGWGELLDDPDMRLLGFGGGASLAELLGPKLVMQAHRVGKPVHGFAQVRKRVMQVVPFYSVDSTSWTAASLYGLLASFDLQRGTVSNSAAGKRARRTMGAKHALGTMASISRGSVQSTDMTAKAGCAASTYQLAADAYAKAEDFYTAYWRARGIEWGDPLGAKAHPANA